MFIPVEGVEETLRLRIEIILVTIINQINHLIIKIMETNQRINQIIQALQMREEGEF